jgi:hypothetical protein
MKKIFSLAFLMVLGCFAFQTLADDVFYVSSNGADTNNGTSTASAFKTLAKAASMVAYDTPATIYMEEDATFNSPATIIFGQDLNVKIIGKNTTVQSGVNPYLGQRILQFATGTNVQISGITFRNGCTRSGIPGGAIFFEGVKMEIDSCSFIDNEGNSSGGALASRGKELIISNSVFHKNRVFSGYGYGGVLWHSGPYPATEPSGSLVIRNCSFTENEAKNDTKGDVISLGHAYRAAEDHTGPEGGIFNGYSNVTYLEVTNCLFKDNINNAASADLPVGAAAIWLYGFHYEMAANIINNTFYKSKALATSLFYEQPFRLVNNVFYNKDAYVIKCSNTSDERDPFIAYNNVVVGEMIKVDDPSFNAQKADFGNQVFAGTDYASLKLATRTETDGSYVSYLPISDATSPLINNGLSSTAGMDDFDKEYIPATDMRGVAVQGIKDIGAYEFIVEGSGIAGAKVESLFSLYSDGENARLKNNSGEVLQVQIRLLDGRSIYSANVSDELTIHKSELEVASGVLIFTVSNGQVGASKKVILF